VGIVFIFKLYKLLTSGNVLSQLIVRVADLVHFWPDPAPDPANQNFKNQIRIQLALTKNQIKHLNFFHIKHTSFNIAWWIFFSEKWKNSPENVSKLYFENIFSLFIQLYIAKIPVGSGSGENFANPAPTKKIRIRNPAYKLQVSYTYPLIHNTVLVE